MLYPLQKKYYLLVHDAIRKAVGADAEISAFVKSKKPFQCDMLVNCALTDPEVPNAPCDFASRLQEYLGACGLSPHKRRLDVIFMDREVLRLALGAPRRCLNNLQNPWEINAEPDAMRRNRLRISLGFDEELFVRECDFKMSLAARIMEKWVYDTYFDPKRETREAFMRSGCPPVEYWLAHGYDLCREFRVDHHVTLAGTISSSFAKFYGEFPFDNPYCAGEDLNTMESVRWLCKAWKHLPVEEFETALPEICLGEKKDSQQE